VTTAAPTFSRWLWAISALWFGLAGCTWTEDKRLRELLHEKGFGSRAEGDATQEEYVGGRDQVQFLVPPEALALPGGERLVELTTTQPIALDGTIFVPYVGPVLALGKTEVELGALVRGQLRTVFDREVDVQARITTSFKVYYTFGETGSKGIQTLTPDLTLWDALLTVRWTNLANLGRVQLIRPDAEHPLVVDVNFREMLLSGNTTANLRLRERDAIYVPPTFLGLIARILQRLLEPVSAAVQTLLGASQAQISYEVLTGQRDAIFFRF
jgi:protein involved in polysaccharide export with SLBB domain